MPTAADVQAAAAARLLARRRARAALLDFTCYTYPQYVADEVHRLIAGALDRVVTGEIQRLMIFAPPQHGKSELVSVRLPAFWLGKLPDEPVIVTSYGATLAESKSRQVRDILVSEEFRQLFGELSPVDEPVALRSDSRAVARWQLAGHRGGMLAVGVGGPVTGHGARLGIIDDPFENWEQAQSATYRDRAWEWYRGTFRTRIWEGGAIVLIMTRWHEDDLAGRLLRDQGSEWTVVRLPALAETQEERDFNDRKAGLAIGAPDPLERAPGAALAPRRYSAQALASIRRDVGSLVWAAEYQGAPTAAEGTLVKRQWLPIVQNAPSQMLGRVRYWDKAASSKATAKYTAGVRVAYSADGLVYVEDVKRGQWSTGDRRAIMRQTAQTDGIETVIGVEQEPGSSGLDSVQDDIRLMAGFAVFADRPSGDKDTRLLPFAAQAEAGNVRLVAGAWNEAFIDELCAIPNGRYRDQSDAVAAGFNRLMELINTPAGVLVVDEAVEISPY